jgi:hypothetical protein
LELLIENLFAAGGIAHLLVKPRSKHKQVRACEVDPS